MELWYLPLQQNQQYFMSIAKRKGGIETVWGDTGLLLFSPCDEEKIYTDERSIKHLKKLSLSQEFIEKWFYFIPNFQKNEEITANKSFFKGYKLSKSDAGFWYNMNIMKRCVFECDKENLYRQHNYEKVIIEYAKNIIKKAKELQFCSESVHYEMIGYQLSIENYFKLKNFYKVIKLLRRSVNLSTLIKFKAKESDAKQYTIQYETHLLNIVSMWSKLSKCLKEEMNVRYLIKKNQIIYKDINLNGFYCEGYEVLKYKKGESLKGILREKSQKKCGYCKLLIETGKYKKGKSKKNKNKKNKIFEKRLKCKNCKSICYCNQHCQKRHWKKHKSKCIAANNK